MADNSFEASLSCLENEEIKNKNINVPPETIYNQSNKKNENLNLDNRTIRLNLIMSKINVLIFCIYIIFDTIFSKNFDFINQIYAYIDRIIMFIISLILLLTYKKMSEFDRNTKFILLIFNLILGIILRILQSIKDKFF